MRRYFQQVRGELVIGWLLALAATTVYLLTLEPTTSFWDCGEFIAVSYLLQVGHPPGAPFYQLLAHAFTWMAGDNAQAVARCCNALSAVAGGLTVMFLFWTILLTVPSEKRKDMRLSALVGSLCYLFCDTAWFSAVESEVYALATFIAAVIVWSALRWYRKPDPRGLLLVAFLTGLGACVHLLTLLTLPVVLLLIAFDYFRRTTPQKLISPNPHLLLLLPLFFLIGLSPYLIIPIRAAAGPPINEGNPSTPETFRAYLTRERYEHAPLYPRMWRKHKNDDIYAASWSGGDTGFRGNVQFYSSYQLTYMYLRYLMWNFSGRYNDRQGFGSPQNGQFITGIPPLDRLLVGTGAPLPDSLPVHGHNRYFLLPLLLGLVGAVTLRRDRRMFWTLTTLFLMGGVILNVYLNHPAYEPRERDYAYILSFYAFAIFIAHGAKRIKDLKGKDSKKCSSLIFHLSTLILLAVPFLMAVQNWDDHNRSHRYIARDAAANILNSCSYDPRGAVLFTYGDNDTFPLWYIQAVEKERLDVRVENIGLMGWDKFIALLDESLDEDRPVYLTHYAYNRFHQYMPGKLLLEGNTFRLCRQLADSGQLLDTVNCDAFFLHLTDGMGWHSLDGVYIDETCCKFIEQYWRDVLVLADNLVDRGEGKKARAALDKTLAEIPLTAIQDPLLIERIAQAYRHAGDDEAAGFVIQHLRTILQEQLDYYHTQTPSRQQAMPYTLRPREELMERL